VQQALAAAREKLVALRLGEVKIVRNPFRDISHAGFILGSEAEDSSTRV
jgi:hypothetical protein